MHDFGHAFIRTANIGNENVIKKKYKKKGGLSLPLAINLAPYLLIIIFLVKLMPLKVTV